MSKTKNGSEARSIYYLWQGRVCYQRFSTAQVKPRLYEPHSDSVPVRLLNTQSKSIVLKSGTKIGTLDMMEDSVIGGVKDQVLSSGITESMRQKLTDLCEPVSGRPVS